MTSLCPLKASYWTARTTVSAVKPCSPLLRRSQLRVRAAAFRKSRDASLPLSLGGAFLSFPVWAQEAVEQITQSDLPSSLPAPEEVASKAPAAAQAGVKAGGSVLDLFADNPIILVGVVFLAAVPVALSFLGGGALGVKQVNAAGALEGLQADPSTVLIDIRSREEAKQQGSPNLSSVKKRAILLPFTRLVAGEVEETDDFVQKFGKLKQIKPDTSIFILDSYGQEAPKAAKQLAKLAGRVYFVRDGSVGANGWKESGQPWKEPGKSIFDLDGIAEDFKNQPTLAKAGFAAGALGVAAAVLFQEAGTAIELAAIAAAGAVAVPRFLQTPSADIGEGTQKQQVKDFVEGAESTVDKAYGGAKKAEQRLEKKAEQAAGSDLGSQVQNAASKVQEKLQEVAASPADSAEKAGNTAEKAESKAEEAVSEVADIASKNAGEAREWIETWRKENANE